MLYRTTRSCLSFICVKGGGALSDNDVCLSVRLSVCHHQIKSVQLQQAKSDILLVSMPMFYDTGIQYQAFSLVYSHVHFTYWKYHSTWMLCVLWIPNLALTHGAVTAIIRI